MGSEGDFLLLGIEESLKRNFVAVNPGNTKLCTETAGIMTVHCFAKVTNHYNRICICRK